MSYTYIYIDPSRTYFRSPLGEPIYTGKGTGNRWKFHLKRTDKHPFVQRLQKMKRDGVEPVIALLCDNVDDELALLVEQEAIDLFGRKDLDKGPLLNLTDGGEGLGYVSDYVRQQMSKSHKGKPLSHKQREGLRRHRIGATMSEVTKSKISAKLRGKIVTDATRAKMSASAKARRHQTKYPLNTGDSQ